jgi:hypothetical protein
MIQNQVFTELFVQPPPSGHSNFSTPPPPIGYSHCVRHLHQVVTAIEHAASTPNPELPGSAPDSTTTAQH